MVVYHITSFSYVFVYRKETSNLRKVVLVCHNPLRT
jgi:hypothetical protein